jgi:hypothetical protein
MCHLSKPWIRRELCKGVYMQCITEVRHIKKIIYINQFVVRKVWKLIITDVIISLNLTTDNPMTKWKRTNTMQKIKDRATRTPLKPGVNVKQFLLTTWYPPVTLVTTRGCRDHDRMIVGFTTTCAISVYHH